MKKLLFIIFFIVIIVILGVLAVILDKQEDKKIIFDKSEVVASYNHCIEIECFTEPCGDSCVNIYVCRDGRYMTEYFLQGILDEEMINTARNNQQGLSEIGSFFEYYAREFQKTNYHFKYKNESEVAPCGYLEVPASISLKVLTAEDYTKYINNK